MQFAHGFSMFACHQKHDVFEAFMKVLANSQFAPRFRMQKTTPDFRFLNNFSEGLASPINFYKNHYKNDFNKLIPNEFYSSVPWRGVASPPFPPTPTQGGRGDFILRPGAVLAWRSPPPKKF